MNMRKEDVLCLLDSQQISYDLVEHGPVHTMEEMDALELANADCTKASVRNDYFLVSVMKL